MNDFSLDLELLDRLAGNTVIEIARSTIEDGVKNTCGSEFDRTHLTVLLNEVICIFSLGYQAALPCPGLETFVLFRFEGYFWAPRFGNGTNVLHFSCWKNHCSGGWKKFMYFHLYRQMDAEQWRVTSWTWMTQNSGIGYFLIPVLEKIFCIRPVEGSAYARKIGRIAGKIDVRRIFATFNRNISRFAYLKNFSTLQNHWICGSSTWVN